jgi:hypothetical protein
MAKDHRGKYTVPVRLVVCPELPELTLHYHYNYDGEGRKLGVLPELGPPKPSMGGAASFLPDLQRREKMG